MHLSPPLGYEFHYEHGQKRDFPMDSHLATCTPLDLTVLSVEVDVYCDTMDVVSAVLDEERYEAASRKIAQMDGL